MEAKRRAEDEAATLRKKMIAMEQNQKKLQEDMVNMKSVDNSMNKTIPNKHVRNVMPNSDFLEELTGEPSAPPGSAQVQNAASSDEVFEPYLFSLH